MTKPFEAAIKALEDYIRIRDILDADDELVLTSCHTAIRVLEAAGKMDGPSSRLFWELCKENGNIQWQALDDFLKTLPLLSSLPSEPQ